MSELLRLDGELTVPWAAERKAELLAFLQPRPAEPVIDLSGVTELDTAGLQLLLMVRAEAARNGTAVRLLGAGPPVLAALRLAGLEDLLDPGEPLEPGVGAR